MNLYKTPQGFTYLPVCAHHIFNWGGLGVCDTCNQNIQYGYLVFVLNRCVCSKCLNEWIERCKSSKKEDIIYDLYQQDLHSKPWYDYHIEAGKIEE